MTSKFLGLALVLLGCIYRSVGFPSDDCANKPADVVFILDSSNSIWLQDFTKETSFVRDVVEHFDIGPGDRQTRVGILTFGHAVWKQFDLNEKLDKDDLLKSVGKIQHGRGRMTNTGDAINYALDRMFTPEAGSRRGVTQVVIVITDGRSQKTYETRKAAKRLHDLNINSFAIGVGRRLDLVELQDIASNPDSEYLFMVDDFNTLSTITGRLARKACEVSTLAPPPVITTPLPPSDQSIRDCYGKPAEVFFIVDSSGSINKKDFNKEISFVQEVVKLLDVAEDRTRVGVISFSHQAEVVVPLDNRLAEKVLLDKIANIRHVGGGTNTAEALKLLRQVGFASDIVRRRVPKIAIVLTDGLSQDEALTDREARFAHASGITVFSIGIGHGVDLIEIKSIASDPDEGHVFRVDDFNSLETIKEVLAEKTCGVKPSEINTKPNDQPACVMKKNTDLMFIYDTNALGARASSVVSTFLSKVVTALDLRSGHLHVGRITDNCPSGGNFQLSSKLSALDFSEIRLPSYSELIRKIQRTGFNTENGGRDEATHVSVLFVDSNMAGLDDSVLQEASLLKEKSEVMVITVGESDMITKLSRQFGNRYYFHANDYADLESSTDQFVTVLCDFFMFDSLDYNIDYVVPV